MTKKVPLIKRSTSYKIIIPANVERQIRFLCERVWDTEWSGVLFYTPSGNFEDGSLEIRCVDILPMDIGNATYTEFNMSPDVISYMAQKPELLDCKMGLIHSHNNMSTFFSGTDTSTLQEEGNDRNHFVSLIVNNAGNYTAAITRKIKYHSIRDLSYEGFNGTVAIDGKEEYEGEEIEYFNLEIVFEEETEDRFKEIADRLKEIKESKKPTTPAYSNWTPSTTTSIYNSPSYSSPSYTKYPSLFDDADFGYPTYPKANSSKESIKEVAKSVNFSTDKELVSPSTIEEIVNQLITGSVTVTKLSRESKEKLIKSMDARFNARFGTEDSGQMLFKYWATDFIEFLLWYTLNNPDIDECDAATEIANKTVAALQKFPKSKYIDIYIDLFIKYADKF